MKTLWMKPNQRFLPWKRKIQDELAKIKERLNDLQEAKKVAMEMHSAACKRLGVPNEFEDEEEDDD